MTWATATKHLVMIAAALDSGNIREAKILVKLLMDLAAENAEAEKMRGGF